VPLTSNTSRQYPGEALVTMAGKKGKALADQIMAADKSRLKNQLGCLSKEDMRAVEDAILTHLGMPK
jgi:Growth inhibitor